MIMIRMINAVWPMNKEMQTLHILVHLGRGKLTNSFMFVVSKYFISTVMLSQTTLMNSNMHQHKAGSLVQTCIINVI